ncbi:MAG: PASTA domain-containing protein, partial [Deltaproteobacteria bacterium]|nr:PASTA domain-containing protein [Deltaproteobacteria bacterium]
DLGGEVTGYVKPYKTWRDIEFSNISFGQGISVNGIQMVMAYAAIANGGNLYKPLIVKKITTAGDRVVSEKTKDLVKKVMDEKSSRALMDMLYNVTQPGGTAKQAHVEGYLSAGKTGTAQKFNNETGAYSDHEYISSFIGVVPVNNPRYAIYVVYDSPSKGGYYGGIVAAPAFKAIAEKTLSSAGIAPPPQVEEKEKATKTAQKKKGKKVKAAVVENKVMTPEEIKKINHKRWELIQESLKNKTVPDLRGLSMREVLKLIREHHLDLKIDGSGFVIRQTPPAGSEFTSTNGWNVVMAGRS